MKYNQACWWPTFHNWKTSGSFLIWVGTDWWRWNRTKMGSTKGQIWMCSCTDVFWQSLKSPLSKFYRLSTIDAAKIWLGVRKSCAKTNIFFEWRWRFQWTRVLIKPDIYQQRLVLLIFSKKWDARSSLNDVYFNGLRIWEEALGRWLQKVEKQTMWQCIDFAIYLRC